MSIIPAAMAGGPPDLECEGTVESGTFRHVRIEDGAECTLTGDVAVLGMVKAKKAGAVTLSGITVGGNVTVDRSSGPITIDGGTTVHGDVNVKRSDADGGLILIGSCDSGGVEVSGSVSITRSRAFVIAVNCSLVGRHLTMTRNWASAVVQADGTGVGRNVRMERNTTPGGPGTGIEFVGDLSYFGGPDGGPVGGKLTFSRNVADELFVGWTVVRKDVQVKGNVSSVMFVGGLTVGGKLGCEKNSADITLTYDATDFDNTVDRKDSCSP